MNATSISKSVGQGQHPAQKIYIYRVGRESRACLVVALAKTEAVPFSPIKNLKFKIKNCHLFREVPRISANFRLTIQPLDSSPCRSLGEGWWKHLNQGPLRELTRINAKYRLTIQPQPARRRRRAVACAARTGPWQLAPRLTASCPTSRADCPIASCLL